MDIDTLIVHCNISLSMIMSIEGGEESCVAESMYRSFELIQRSHDLDSWCSYLLCVCIFKCYALNVLLFLSGNFFYAIYE
jgi:hypothetical protein